MKQQIKKKNEKKPGAFLQRRKKMREKEKELCIKRAKKSP